MAQALPDLEITQEVKDIEIDEMWHYLQQKKASYGY
jgi:hypothetical protein